MEGEVPSRKEGRVPRRSRVFSGVVGDFHGMSKNSFKGLGEDSEEEEESEGTKGVPSPVGVSESTGGKTLAQSNKPACHHPGPSVLDTTHKINKIMANIQVASSSEASRPQELKILLMKAPECFYGTQPSNFRRCIQLLQLIFHNDKENLSEGKKKVLYSISFFIGRAEKWIEPYLSNITNKEPSYLLNN
ncbi:hypothetical protein O181_015279 [Austropuccinia psidii MF-1]|uniref:DUF4939 domain-containing protein n=1 Tax=Austropuccinia psidii MF-1 TaxID=1389203 RepID=A0A9Q3C1R0_9BASI|nr:hypothetical protein [Austropuccinia psidii MF-1]